MKDQLIYDATDANTIADSDSVGSFTLAGDGTPITATAGALDVNVTNSLGIDVDLVHTEDSVRLGDGTSFFTSTSESGDIALDVHISNASLAVTATQLDVDDLTFADDKVDASGSTLGANSGVDIGDVTINNAAGASAVNIQDGGNSITVDAVQLDIDDLNATDDAVAAWLSDGSGNAISSTGGAIDVNIASGTLSVNDVALANVAISTEAETLDVASTAQAITASVLSGRKYLYVYNKDNRQMEIGAAGFSFGGGFPISPGAYVELRAGAASVIHFNSPKINHEIRLMQLS